MSHQDKSNSRLAATTLAALGIVFGDIGTSPLYALRECFHGPHSIGLSEANVLGILSLILWSLIIVISIKYLAFVLRADNKGEGGILALMALASPRRFGPSRARMSLIIILGLFGTALLYGDGIITPAISVLSAVEGLKIATPVLEPYVILITTVILVGLFFFQSRGTAKIGTLFGPVILVWFITLGVLGLNSIMETPHVLTAVNPLYGFKFLTDNSFQGFVVLGSVFLVVTGGEALYADLGHFGRKPIQLGWFLVALPGLTLQYFGQGALLLRDSSAVENPFYLLAPSWALYPLVALATCATIIASQALLTGAFSLSQQAAQLGYLPRMVVRHTSAEEKGQIYVPFLNWSLLAGTLFLVFEFRTSSNLAAAYGIAVTATMVITTLLTFVVMRKRWRWKTYLTLPLTVLFLIVDLAFLGANSLKILEGGWVPLVLATFIFVLMATWKRGRKILHERLTARAIPLEKFCKEVAPTVQTRVPGSAIFMTATIQGTPSALVQNVQHNQVLHETVVVLTVITDDVPHVGESERIKFELLKEGIYRVIAHYGFMESPNIPSILAQCRKEGVKIDKHRVTFFLGRETLIATDNPGMAIWREHLFAFMSRNAQRATDYFKIPANQAIEIGTVVEM